MNGTGRIPTRPGANADTASGARVMDVANTTAAGFFVAIVLMAGIREKIEHNNVPEAFKGTPIVLVTAGLMAIAFCGFSGLI